MSSDTWTGRLSEYLDGELNDGERRAIERHLESCNDCILALRDLEAVRARARSLDDRPPAHDLWRGIAERIGSSAGVPASTVQPIESARSRKAGLLHRSVTLRMPQLAAAAVALVLVSGGAVAGLVSMHRSDSSPVTPVAPAASALRPGLAAWNTADGGGARYDSVVAELEQALAENRGQLDTATVRIIRNNLAIIDQAIEQARRALLADPGSLYVNSHLAATLRRKIDLLRQATALRVTRS